MPGRGEFQKGTVGRGKKGGKKGALKAVRKPFIPATVVARVSLKSVWAIISCNCILVSRRRLQWNN